MIGTEFIDDVINDTPTSSSIAVQGDTLRSATSRTTLDLPVHLVQPFDTAQRHPALLQHLLQDGHHYCVVGILSIIDFASLNLSSDQSQCAYFSFIRAFIAVFTSANNCSLIISAPALLTIQSEWTKLGCYLIC